MKTQHFSSQRKIFFCLRRSLHHKISRLCFLKHELKHNYKLFTNWSAFYSLPLLPSLQWRRGNKDKGKKDPRLCSYMGAVCIQTGLRVHTEDFRWASFYLNLCYLSICKSSFFFNSDIGKYVVYVYLFVFFYSLLPQRFRQLVMNIFECQYSLKYLWFLIVYLKIQIYSHYNGVGLIALTPFTPNYTL